MPLLVTAWSWWIGRPIVDGAPCADTSRRFPAQAFVQRGSRHCKECCKCVLNFDHHCKWVNNCIGSRNYTPFMVLLTSVCTMLAVQIAAGVQLLVLCFTPTEGDDSTSPAAAAAAGSASPFWAVTPRLQSAYPLAPSREGFTTAICCYLVLLLVALYGLGDLWLLHLVLLARGMAEAAGHAMSHAVKNVMHSRVGMSSHTMSCAITCCVTCHVAHFVACYFLCCCCQFVLTL
jgi:palmitoyltransferase